MSPLLIPMVIVIQQDPESEVPAEFRPSVADVDAAAVALSRVRQAAAAAGFAPESAHVRRRKPTSEKTGRRRQSGTQQQNKNYDPRLLGSVFSRLVTERGWQEPVAVGSVVSRWPELVGAEIAAHAEVVQFENAEVVIQCDSTAWATQLRLMTPTLLRQFEEQLGPGVITKITIKGPQAPSWRKGPRVVRGRGPRDTYG